MQPSIEFGQWLCGQSVDATAALRLVGHQSGVAQHLEVLGDCGATEVEPLAEFTRRQLLAGEDFQQLPAHRVRQSDEDAIGGRHIPQYTSEISDTSMAERSGIAGKPIRTRGRAPATERTFSPCPRRATFHFVHFAWEQLAPRVHRCRLPFCDVTIGLIHGSTAALLVDTGTTLTEAAAVDSDVRELAGRPVTHIVLTHKHFDHVLGSSWFAGADIYCAPDVVEYLASATGLIRRDALRYGADAAEIDRAIAALRPPQHGVYDAVIDLGDRRVTVAFLGGGHTTSDLVVVAPGSDADEAPSVVFTGDLVEESADPAIDADSDVAAWPGTLDRVLAAGGPDASYVPGHGAVVDAEFIRGQRDWLRRRAGLTPG
jgi:glyoxylase-like metal-dependent hydrolase (beta-lactamase superfamily II)